VTNILRNIKTTADLVAASMLAAMSIVFIYQIIGRYFGNAIESLIGIDLATSWTLEILLTLWVWLVFWASAFCLSERDHIRFDTLHLALPRKVQRIVAGLSALAIAGFLAYSFLPTLDYITFYKIKKSAILRIRLDYVFSIYGIFLAALVARYAWRAVAFSVPSLHNKFYQKVD
jgi:C4-dicarboxylate transporter DctQ subunit